jgi:hypothetical protein
LTAFLQHGTDFGTTKTVWGGAMFCKQLTAAFVLLALCAGIPGTALSATNSGIDTPTGVTTLPLAVQGVEAMDLVTQASGSIYVGVGTSSPQSALDVNGDVRMGDSGLTCAASNVGAMHYNAAALKVEVCSYQNGAYAWGGMGMPTGSVIAMAGPTCPSGSLPADGTAYAATTYPALCAAIGNANGGNSSAGCGSGSFRVPDYRGQFLRGVSGASGRDPDDASRTAMNAGGNTGDNVGSVEASALGPHSHILNGGTGVMGYVGASARYTGPSGSGPQSWPQVTQTGTTGTGMGDETRPTNAYVEYCVVY